MLLQRHRDLIAPASAPADIKAADTPPQSDARSTCGHDEPEFGRGQRPQVFARVSGASGSLCQRVWL
jgi:hypothetical protein